MLLVDMVLHSLHSLEAFEWSGILVMRLVVVFGFDFDKYGDILHFPCFFSFILS